MKAKVDVARCVAFELLVALGAWKDEPFEKLLEEPPTNCAFRFFIAAQQVVDGRRPHLDKLHCSPDRFLPPK